MHCEDTRLPLTLNDLGAGGFSLRSPAVLPVGVVMRFEFRTADARWATTLSAKSVYSRPDPESPDGSLFLNGFMFLHPETPTVMARINALIDRATAVISFS